MQRYMQKEQGAGQFGTALPPPCLCKDRSGAHIANVRPVHLLKETVFTFGKYVFFN